MLQHLPHISSHSLQDAMRIACFWWTCHVCELPEAGDPLWRVYTFGRASRWLCVDSVLSLPDKLLSAVAQWHSYPAFLCNRHRLQDWFQVPERQRGLWRLLLSEGHPQPGLHLVGSPLFS